MTQRDKVIELEKKKKIKAIAMASMANVLKIPSGSPDRWRAAYIHFLKQRPEAQVEAMAVTNHNNEIKLTLDKLGRTKHGRYVMSSPSFLLPVLRNTDPDYFIGADDNKLSGAEHLKRMKKAFPEFFLPTEV